MAAVPQYEYITIYDAKAQPADFGTNGIAILCPDSCTVDETLNGNWYATMTHPIDNNGIWRSVFEFRILKILGNLFVINRAETSYSGRKGKIAVDAEHITYKMNDGWIAPETIVGEDLHVQAILSNLRDRREGMRAFNGSELYEFNGASDDEMTVPDFPMTYPSGKSWGEAIFDVLDKSGGELYRENFYYSIRNRMENAIDNAFEIRIGFNLKGIKRIVDTSSMYTYFSAYDANNNRAWSISYNDQSFGNLQIPDTVHRTKQYPSGDIILQATRDFRKNSAPKITYEIDMYDTRNNPDFAITKSIRYKVGDTGRIFDERLGGVISAKIIRTQTDGITGKTLKIELESTTGFISEGRDIPIPVFPEIPKKRYDETKISLILLDENLQETDEITTYNTALEVAAALKRGSPNNFNIYVGKEASTYSIPAECFALCQNLINITTGNVETIRDGAFKQCSNLKTVTFGDNLKYINKNAFNLCTSIESLNLPDSVMTIGENAFNECSSMELIKFPKNLATIPSHVCYGCGKLETVVLPQNVTSLGAGSFAITSIKSIVFPDTLITIENNCFDDCKSLESVELSPSLKTIGENAFLDCSSLRTVKFKTGLQTIGERAFKDCTSLESVSMPDSVVTLGERAFDNCTSLISIKFSNGLQVIPAFCCYYATSLKTIVFPENLLTIQIGAFYRTAIEEIILPESLVSITNAPYYASTEGAFGYCTQLKTVVLNNNITTLQRAFPVTSIEKIEIPTSVREISSTNFGSCNELEEITVKNTKKSISGDPWGAPYFIPYDTPETAANKDKHKVKWLGADITEAEKICLIELDSSFKVSRVDLADDWRQAAAYITSYPAVNFDIIMTNQAPVSTIPEACFKDMENLRSVEIPSKFSEIGENAFSGCENMDFVEVAKHKGDISGEPWGAPEGTAIYYAAELTTANGDVLAADENLTARVTDSTQTINTGLNGISAEIPASPADKTLYIISKSNGFALQLGEKELKR